MTLPTIFSLFLYFSSFQPITDINCNQLVQVMADHDTAVKTYKNRYEIPVVDKNGKMMFDVQLSKRGAIQNLKLIPARDCRFESNSMVTIVLSSGVEYVIVGTPDSQATHIDMKLDKGLTTALQSSKIVSIAFRGMKYDYEIVFKPNQSRVVSDVVNCMQY